MTEVSIFKQEVREVLENNILRFWIDRMQDNEHGGFYGRIDNNNVLYADADKGAILNARILWTFSAAYRVLGKSEYLKIATRAKRYFIDHFIDPEYGGVYWSLDYKGQPKDTKKQFYAIGFAIYGLSEYARATNDQEALEQAINLYRYVEEHALDKEYNGYIEAMTRNWQPIDDMRLSESMTPTIPSRRTPICISSSPMPTSTVCGLLKNWKRRYVISLVSLRTAYLILRRIISTSSSRWTGRVGLVSWRVTDTTSNALG